VTLELLLGWMRPIDTDRVAWLDCVYLLVTFVSLA